MPKYTVEHAYRGTAVAIVTARSAAEAKRKVREGSPDVEAIQGQMSYEPYWSTLQATYIREATAVNDAMLEVASGIVPHQGAGEQCSELCSCKWPDTAHWCKRPAGHDGPHYWDCMGLG